MILKSKNEIDKSTTFAPTNCCYSPSPKITENLIVGCLIVIVGFTALINLKIFLGCKC